MGEKITVFPRDVAAQPPPSAVGAGWMRPFVYRDPATIPPRRWLYGHHLCRGYISATLGAGGGGKSALSLIEALAMATGQPLLGVQPDEPQPLRVWCWNGEDPVEETERRIAGAALHYRLDPAALEERLMVGSGREGDLIVAEQTHDGTVVNAPNVEALKRMIRDEAIDVVVIDPFISSHRVLENDNGAIDRVVKTWAKIAEETSAAVELIHHVRKGPRGEEATVEDGRGASALLAAVRSARVLNVMSDAEATSAGIERRRAYFRVENGKANLAPPPEKASWFHFISQPLGNGDRDAPDGDSVGVVTSWAWPDHRESVTAADLLQVQRTISAGSWRKDPQCKAEWVGVAVAKALHLSTTDKAERAKINTLLRMWVESGALTTEVRRDAKSRDREFVVVGDWASLTPETFS